MLKSDNLIKFRNNIDRLYKNNASIYIEERITKYYLDLLNDSLSLIISFMEVAIYLAHDPYPGQ